MEKNSLTSSLQRRSIGVTISGILLILWGLYRFSFQVVYFDKSLFFAKDPFALRAVIGIIFPLLMIIIGIGVLCLRNWARICFRVMCIFQIAISIFDLVGGILGGEAIYIFSFLSLGVLVISTIFVIFFNHPKVKEQFK